MSTPTKFKLTHYPQFPMIGVMAENGTVLCYPPSSVKITSAYAAPGPVTASVNDD